MKIDRVSFIAVETIPASRQFPAIPGHINPAALGRNIVGELITRYVNHADSASNAQPAAILGSGVAADYIIYKSSIGASHDSSTESGGISADGIPGQCQPGRLNVQTAACRCSCVSADCIILNRRVTNPRNTILYINSACSSVFSGYIIVNNIIINNRRR